ncbi:hypothetical protein FACS189465_0620 [Clostridia bacterium]|nr:hypothetical protein FACS189465_0620 [Clostridia bacterium]
MQKAITEYNSMVIGIQNYYQIATHVSLDMSTIARVVSIVAANRLKSKLNKNGNLEQHDYIRRRYGKSKQIRFVSNTPLVPVGYVQTKNAMHKKTAINKYTVDGRREIHKNLGVDLSILRELMRTEVTNESTDFMDNRVSLYAAQTGKCGITGKHLEIDEIYCHRKVPKEYGGTDKYRNLMILHVEVHELIHASDETTALKHLNQFKLDNKQLAKLNKLRKMAHNVPLAM